MERYGWRLLFYTEFSRQRGRLKDAAERAQRRDPGRAVSNSNLKLLRAVDRAILEVIPQDPSRPEYRQGNTLGRDYQHWRRVKIGRRFRLFFRYDAKAKVIVYAWMNDESTLRASGSKTDPYAVFTRMLAQGNPPNGWASLIAGSAQHPSPEQ
ncbi:MAG: type II toxin-antitoxin system YhaV family toxin [bacterium]|nr:type II toxin-antitoxin system YhaV family toxin [bacterium]